MVKRIIICTMLCLLVCGGVRAQRYLPGMRGIQVTGGVTDGFKKSGGSSGFHFGMAMATYTKNGNRWVFGGEYLQKYYPYRDIRIPVGQFTAEGGYYVNFLSDATKTFFLSAGASALAGYETGNRGQKTLYDGSVLTGKDAFIYGGAITLELETYLTDRWVLLLNVRQRILYGTFTGHFHTQFGVGLKYIL